MKNPSNFLSLSLEGNQEPAVTLGHFSTSHTVGKRTMLTTVQIPAHGVMAKTYEIVTVEITIINLCDQFMITPYLHFSFLFFFY